MILIFNETSYHFFFSNQYNGLCSKIKKNKTYMNINRSNNNNSKMSIHIILVLYSFRKFSRGKYFFEKRIKREMTL